MPSASSSSKSRSLPGKTILGHQGAKRRQGLSHQKAEHYFQELKLSARWVGADPLCGDRRNRGTECRQRIEPREPAPGASQPRPNSQGCQNEPAPGTEAQVTRVKGVKGEASSQSLKESSRLPVWKAHTVRGRTKAGEACSRVRAPP